MDIRNFCIIAHIDHGKSTLADRLLEFTHAVSDRELKEQFLDQMDLERERGITIKLQPVRMEYEGVILNLIDTPGHVDFTYEVSRSLAAVEGAILVVDATQGIEAQTLANVYLAIEHGLTIIPVINKIDLPSADIDKVSDEIIGVLGCDRDTIIPISAKTGKNVESVLKAVVKQVPSPTYEADAPLKALIFDSVYDDYQGAVAYIRIVQGTVKLGEEIYLCGSNVQMRNTEIGVFAPYRMKKDILSAGEIGYIVTGSKHVQDIRVGDTMTHADKKADALPGYKVVTPMVYAGIYTVEGDAYDRLRDALLKLQMNDASLSFEPDVSEALGFGFRCGFLGLLHLDVIRERLSREFDLEVIITNPSVKYEVFMRNGETRYITHPTQLPDVSLIDEIREPTVRLEIVTPSDYIGNVMTLVSDMRGTYKSTDYLDANRAVLTYTLPLHSILVDFYDKLKSVSSGYASMNYEIREYEPAPLVKMEILVAGNPVDPFATLVYKSEAEHVGRAVVKKLKELLPRQMFEIKLQAVIGSKVVASERISAMRKDVTAKLYGGDVTRKQKLLKKQKEGKKRMATDGSVEIPPKAYLEIMRTK